MEWLDDGFTQDPHQLYARLRTERPVLPVRLPHGLKVWLVTRYADVRAALADPRLRKDARQTRPLFERHSYSGRGSAFGEALTEHMLNTDPPHHERLRKLVTKAFTAGRIERLRPRVEQITEDLLTDLAARGEADLLSAFAFPLPITVICELLGVPDADRDDFRSWSTTLVSSANRKSIRAATTAMADYLTDLVAGKRDQPRDDLVSALVRARDADDRLSENELISMVFLLLVAGHETTVNLIANGTLALLRSPDQLAALRADRTLLPGAVEEFLRFDGPINLATLRFTAEPVQIGGALIPAGEFVMVALASANRDPERYIDPDRLDISRDAGGQLAFGHGIHYCLGAPLARLEGEVAFAGLLDRFDRIELAVDPDRLRWRESALMRGLRELPVRVG